MSSDLTGAVATEEHKVVVTYLEDAEMSLPEVGRETGIPVIHQNESDIGKLKEITSSSSGDSEKALQKFLDSIPISSIPGIGNRKSPVLELKTTDCLRDAITLLHEKNVYGAPITDASPTAIPSSGNSAAANFSDRYIGFIDLPTMVLWCLTESEKSGSGNGEANEDGNSCGFFSSLDRNPTIAQTKVAELAKLFLWDPFIPVREADSTLFHVLLLFSNHRVSVLPVVSGSDGRVTGYITQNAVLHLLLQSSGLEWFDGIASMPLSDFLAANKEPAHHVYSDQTVLEALHLQWQNRGSEAIAVVHRTSGELMGHMRNSDIHLLLDKDDAFSKMGKTTAAEFMQLDEALKEDTESDDKTAFLSAGNLRLRNRFMSNMSSPVTHLKDGTTLEQAMRKMAKAKSDSSFVVDGSHRIDGVLTLRSIIVQFAPPGVDSRIGGGGFFDSALEQSGCRVERGTLVRDH